MGEQIHSSAAAGRTGRHEARRRRPLSAAQERILFAVLFGLGLGLQLAALFLHASA